MPVTFELNPAYVVLDSKGNVSDTHYLSGPAGEFSLIPGQALSVQRDNGDGTFTTVNIPEPTQQQLQDTYDADPAFADLIIPADGHVPPWAP